MKKLLAGALCALSLAMPVCAVNGDNAANDQNDALDNAAAVAHDEVRNVQSELYRVLRRALLFGELFDRPENCINIISNLIHNGAELDDRILSDRDSGVLSNIVFNNPNFNQFPDDVRNHILGKALLFYVKNRFCYSGPYNYNQELKYNYKAIKALWKLNPPIDFELLIEPYITLSLNSFPSTFTVILYDLIFVMYKTATIKYAIFPNTLFFISLNDFFEIVHY